MGYPGPENPPKAKVKVRREEEPETPKERCRDVLLKWVRSATEAVLVYGAGIALVLTVVALMRLPAKGYPREEALGFVRALHDNWRAFVILSAPLLYGPVKKFVDEAEEAFGVKRTRAPMSVADRSDKIGDGGQIREPRERDAG